MIKTLAKYLLSASTGGLLFSLLGELNQQPGLTCAVGVGIGLLIGVGMVRGVVSVHLASGLIMAVVFILLATGFDMVSGWPALPGFVVGYLLSLIILRSAAHSYRQGLAAGDRSQSRR